MSLSATEALRPTKSERLKMTRWTENNTEGFTAEELEILNDAQERLESDNPGIDASNISDLLNNTWVPGITADELVSKSGL